MSETAVPPATDTAVDLDYDELSDAQRLALQPPDIVDEFFSSLTDEEANALLYEWSFWARPKQKPPPGNWTYWLLLAGRGFGKTKTVAHWAIDKARDMPGSRGAVVAATAADARDVLVEGASGILASSPPDFMPVYEPSKRRLTWPNGSVATIFSADQPDRLRGPQFHWAVADELAAWRFAQDAWDMLQFGLRLGENPQCAIATTPRPTAVIKELVADENCVVTHGTTYENRENLAPAFFRQVIAKYENTRLGRQELLAQILDDVPGALWNRDLLDSTRVKQALECFKIVVAVDPASSTGTTGIVVVGVGKLDGITHGYVLEDCTTEAGASPGAWGLAAVQAYHRWQADAIVAEVNHGGNMVEHVIRTVEGGKNVSYRAVRASRGKYTRAEPVASLFEQKKAHCVGMLGLLEDELCTWIPGEDSPNRLDAMVWGFTDLMLDGAQDVAMPPPVGLNKPSQWRN